MLIDTDTLKYAAAPQQLSQNGERVQKFKIGNRASMTATGRNLPARRAIDFGQKRTLLLSEIIRSHVEKRSSTILCSVAHSGRVHFCLC